MSLLSRIKAFIGDYPQVPNTADTDEEEEEREELPWNKCRWIELTARCRIPLNDSENLPHGCDAKCPARLLNEHHAISREYENNERLYH